MYEAKVCIVKNESWDLSMLVSVPTVLMVQIQSPTLAICLEALILCTEDVSLLSVPLDFFPATIRMCVLLTENKMNILWLLFQTLVVISLHPFIPKFKIL